MIFPKELKHALDDLQIPKGCDLMVHSSMRSFETPISGGAEALLDVLIERIGASGTLLMPTLSFSSVCEEHPVFDAAKTPSDCGFFTEYFRKIPGARRSMHPLSSACAFGARASYYTQYHADTPCGPETPYAKLVKERGWVLFIGAGFGSNTIFHVAEEQTAPSYMRYASVPNVTMIAEDGKQYIATFRRYDCYQTGILRDLNRMEPIFEAAGVLQRTQVANSLWTAIPAAENCLLSCEILQKNPQFILQT